MYLLHDIIFSLQLCVRTCESFNENHRVALVRI